MRMRGFVFGNSAALKIVLSERYILKGGRLCEDAAREKTTIVKKQISPRLKSTVVLLMNH